MPMKEEQYEQRQQQQRQHHDAKNRMRGKGQEQRAGVLRERERSGRERRMREKGRPTYLYEEQRRDRGLTQKRANVGKIGGGSLQLLAGMSGNAWDSILKARPRQSPLPLRLTLQPLFSRLSSTAIPWGPYLVQGDLGNTSRLPDRVARSPWIASRTYLWTTLTRCVTYTRLSYARRIE